MARTSKSRGGSGFAMRSGNSTSFKSMGGGETPYPFLKGLGKALGGGLLGGVKGIIDKIKEKKASKAAEAATIEASGSTGGSDEKLKLIGEIITSDEGGAGGGIVGDLAEGTALTKKSPMQNYKNPRDYKVFNMGNEASPSFKKRKKANNLNDKKY